MSLSRIPLPSIAHVLAADRAPLPPRPSVIRFEFDPLQTIYPSASSRDQVLDPLDIQNDTIDVGTDQYNKAPVVDESFFFCLANDSSTVGHSDRERLDDVSGAQIVFAQKKPTTSPHESKGLTGDVMLKGNIMALAGIIRNLLLQVKLKRSPLNKVAQVTQAVVDV